MSMRLPGLILVPLLAVALAQAVGPPELRLSAADVDAMGAHEAGSGTSGVAGIRTTVVAGDPTRRGPYHIRLTIPPGTRIQAHTHRDNRSAVVVAGVRYFG
jgi:quercetin dioxygenase-like cupin family protein